MLNQINVSEKRASHLKTQKSDERNLRSRYFRVNVKRKLNRKQYPIKAPTPIQYQCASGKIPRDFKIETPNGSLEFGGIYSTDIFRYSVIAADQNNSSHILCFNFKFENFCQHSRQCCLPVSNSSLEIRSQQWHSVHTSMVRSSNPISTIS